VSARIRLEAAQQAVSDSTCIPMSTRWTGCEVDTSPLLQFTGIIDGSGSFRCRAVLHQASFARIKADPPEHLVSMEFRVGDTVIESTAGHGMREVPWYRAVGPDDRSASMFFRCERPEAVLAAARSQIGKAYGTSAILGFIGRRGWQEQDSWFCSELVAWAFVDAGQALFRPDSIHRVTPGHLWMLGQGVAPVPVERSSRATDKGIARLRLPLAAWASGEPDSA
jgi:hypothetical protein